MQTLVSTPLPATCQRKDGRWSLQHSYKGRTCFELERLGAPSRWNTLRVLRVLKWWDRK